MRREKTNKQEIFVYEDEENVNPARVIKSKVAHGAAKVKPKEEIYVFDDDEDGCEEEIMMHKKGTLTLNKKEAPPMSEEEYSKKCH